MEKNDTYDEGLKHEAIVIKYLKQKGNVTESTKEENIEKDIDCYLDNIAVSIKSYRPYTPQRFGFELRKMNSNGIWRDSWYYNGKASVYYIWHIGTNCLYKLRKIDVQKFAESKGFEQILSLSPEVRIQQAQRGHADRDTESGYIAIKTLLENGIAKKVHSNFNYMYHPEYIAQKNSL